MVVLFIYYINMLFLISLKVFNQLHSKTTFNRLHSKTIGDPHKDYNYNNAN